MDIVKQVTDAVAAESKKMSKISKEDFKENLTLVMGQLDNFVSTISNLQGPDRLTFAKRIQTFATSGGNTFCSTYVNIAKAIKGKDLNEAFASYITTANNLKTVLAMVERNINVIFSEKFLTIFNAKLSNAVVFEIVNRCGIFSNYATYLFDGILYEIIVNEGEHELNKPRPYRYEYVKKYEAGMIELLKLGTLPNGANMIITEIDKLRKSIDPTLIDNSNGVNKDLSQVKQGIGLIQGTFTVLSTVFRYFGEWWVVLRNLKYQKMMKEKEWLENHVDLLRLQLSGVDPNSDEYRKAVKIINTYNDMIAQLDQKINEYLES